MYQIRVSKLGNFTVDRIATSGNNGEKKKKEKVMENLEILGNMTKKCQGKIVKSPIFALQNVFDV